MINFRIFRRFSATLKYWHFLWLLTTCEHGSRLLHGRNKWFGSCVSSKIILIEAELSFNEFLVNVGNLENDFQSTSSNTYTTCPLNQLRTSKENLQSKPIRAKSYHSNSHFTDASPQLLLSLASNPYGHIRHLSWTLKLKTCLLAAGSWSCPRVTARNGLEHRIQAWKQNRSDDLSSRACCLGLRSRFCRMDYSASWRLEGTISRHMQGNKNQLMPKTSSVAYNEKVSIWMTIMLWSIRKPQLGQYRVVSFPQQIRLQVPPDMAKSI